MSLKQIPDPPSNFTVGDSRSEELLKLSFKERQALEEEIHGVRCLAAEESPRLLEESLLDFDDKINKLKEESEDKNVRKFLRNVVRTKSSPTADATTTTGKANCYLNRNDIRLRFLRAEFFDVDKAVQRFVCFLEYCSEIFGDYICDREMRLSDFNTREEEAALRSSRTQYLPHRDRSGRRVLIGVGNLNFQVPLMTRLKILMFQHWCSSEDLETQTKGIVIVAWPFDEKEGSDCTWEKVIRPSIGKDNASYQRRNNAAMPVRVASYHMYYKDTPIFHALSALYVFHALNPAQRARYKAHFGEQTELLYKLGSYGISVDLLPVSYTGSIKFGHMNAWLTYQRAREKRSNGRGGDDEVVDCPWSRDVLFRKGTTFRDNVGNTFYRTLIGRYSDEHAIVPKKKKRDITLQIITDVEEHKGRFLEWSTQKQLWIVMKDRERIRKKIAAAFKQFWRKRKEASSSRREEPKAKPLQVLGSSNLVQMIKNERPTLKEYYSKHPVQKRQKTSVSDRCNISLCGINDGSCFGKPFQKSDSEPAPIALINGLTENTTPA